MKRRKISSKKQIRFWAAVIITVILFFMQYFGGEEAAAPPRPIDPDASEFENVEIISVYDGDTFKINLNCKEDVLCGNISVRVRGVDCPEIKGKTAKEKRLAQKAKTFTENFLSAAPVNLKNCGRDKYFRLLCDVEVNGADLGSELLRSGLAYPYDGGAKKDVFL